MGFIFYIGGYYLTQKQTVLDTAVVSSEILLRDQHTMLIQLKKMIAEIQRLFKEMPKESKSRRALGDFFQKLVRKHYFLSFHFAILKEEIFLQGTHAQIQKIPIRLHFSTRLDDNVWEFLKDLHREFPGITLARDLSLEKIEMCEQKNSRDVPILKGTYLFDWYIFVPL